MGGSKGQSTQQTAQSQTYTPNQQAYGYLTDALSRAQQTANLPFNVPQAPVAGFSQDQQSAFQTVNNAQGMASPYYAQAANFFSPQGAQAFYNPMAQSVTNQLQNIFGQQNSQNTGQLTQAAGGVGADRIAVGQANLANQQGLAAGQTYANLYQQAVQQAQQAGQNYQNLGTTAQNTALQGAQAQLGTGGLQQQLQQAQLNAPYQQQVAQAQFPYQQAQWYGNLVGGLAPGLGGTTQGTGNTTSTPAQPSIWSQLLGGGLAAAGGLGQSGAFGSQGWLTGSSPSYGGGNFLSGDAYGGSGSNPLPGLSAEDYGAGFAEGGDVSDEPIDIAAHPFIQAGQMHAIQPHIPQLNLNPPQQSGGGGGSGGGLGDIIGMAAKVLPFLARGGTIPNPFADGGEVSDDERAMGTDLLREKMLASGYVPNQGEPIRMPDQASTDAWRRSVDATNGRPNSEVLALAPESAPSPDALPTASTAAADSPALPPEQSAAAPSFAPGHSHDRSGFMDSPWAALTAAGLGIMGGTSPFAGVNIGQGGQKGLAMLQQQRENAQKDETTEQAARRLEQEAQAHLDSMTKMSPYQSAQIGIAKAKLEKDTDAATLDNDTAKYIAQAYAGGNKGVLAGLGYGKVGAANRAMVFKYVRDLSPDARSLNAAAVDFAASGAAASTAARQAAGIDRAVIEAQNTFPLAEQASAAVPRGQWVPINRAMLAIKSGTSDPAMAQFVVANQGAVNAYAAAMGRGNPVTTVHAQQHAEELLSTATSHAAYAAALHQMQKEMDAAQAAPAQVRQNIHNQITGQAAPQTQPAGSPQPASVPAGAASYLRAHPEARGDFERKYGAGSSVSILGQ